MPADTTLTLYGAGHLATQTATVQLGGLDLGDFTVGADGSIVLTYGTPAVFTIANLVTISAAAGAAGLEQAVALKIWDGTVYQSLTLPVVIGLNYTTQGQMLRALSEAQTKNPLGPSLGDTRRGHRFAAMIVNGIANAISFGTDFSNLFPAPLWDTDQNTTLSVLNAFNGVYWAPLNDKYGLDGQLAWQINRPLPLTITAAGVFLETEEQR